MYASTTEQRRESQVQELADKLYRERCHYLLRIATRNSSNSNDAEEAVQFAFLAFLRHFDPAGEAPPLAWLILTLKRDCWSRHRTSLNRGAAQQAGPGSAEPGLSVEANPSSVAGPEEAIERAERVVEARAQLARLKSAERRALGLIAAGFSYAEIGEMNEWTYTKINRCASEGRAALRASAPTAYGAPGTRGAIPGS